MPRLDAEKVKLDAEKVCVENGYYSAVRYALNSLEQAQLFWASFLAGGESGRCCRFFDRSGGVSFMVDGPDGDVEVECVWTFLKHILAIREHKLRDAIMAAADSFKVEIEVTKKGETNGVES